MAQETLKITITADNQQAVKNIQETVTATTKLGTAFKTLPSTSNQATYALSNLSRVAQDAPYGFIGIANNLNPLLESFQRLQVSAGSTGGALKAMASGLMGPAGIGLALGAVSSIIVAFGPKIADFISGTTEASKAEDKFAQSLRDARAEASETGIRLQAYLSISESANVSEERRAEALKAVVTELSKVNSAYASTITNVDQARAAVDLYTKALVNQALTTRYIDKIADKTESLNDVNKKILQTGRDYFKTIDEQNRLIAEGRISAAVDQAVAAKELKKQNIEARKEGNALKNEIIDTRVEVKNLLVESANNPFFNFTKGANEATNATNNTTKSIEKLGKQARVLKVGTTAIIETENKITTPETPNKLSKDLPMFAQQYTADQIFKNEAALRRYNTQLQIANGITDTLTPAFEAMFSAMANGENIGKALEQTFKNILVQLSTMIIKTLIFKGIMAALGIPTAGAGGGFTNFNPIGAAGDGGGAFVLRGQDLLLATNRAQKASNLKGQNISLA
jgi:hypothetical protein